MASALGWRVVTETVKQKWGLSMDAAFRATSNARNEAMFREASIFASHLRQVEKDLTSWERGIESTFTNMRGIMLSPLPRVYEEGHSGQAVPSEPEPTLIGGDVQVERLTSSAQETRKRLDIEVLQPIKQWMVAYRTIAERMKRLEALRLELDSRRRTVTDLQAKCERTRASLATMRTRGEVELEVGLRKMQHKEDKMQRAMSQYQEMEQTVYNSLFTLIKDTCVLRDYAAAAILIVQEAFQGGYAAFEPALPQYSASALPAAYQPPMVMGPAVSEAGEARAGAGAGADQAVAKPSKLAIGGATIKAKAAPGASPPDKGFDQAGGYGFAPPGEAAGGDVNSSMGTRYWQTAAAAAAY